MTQSGHTKVSKSQLYTHFSGYPLKWVRIKKTCEFSATRYKIIMKETVRGEENGFEKMSSRIELGKIFQKTGA